MKFISSQKSIVFGRIQNCVFIFAKKILMYQDYLRKGNTGTVLESHKILP